MYSVNWQPNTLVGPNNFILCFGSQIGPLGILQCNINDVMSFFYCVQEAFLKWLQKLNLLHASVIPTICNSLSMQLISKSHHVALDVRFRSIVHSIVWLPHYMPLGFFYACCCDGGLGIMAQRTSVPLLAVCRCHWMHDDKVWEISLLAEGEYVQNIIESYVKMLIQSNTDKSVFHFNWKFFWNGSCAGKGLGSLSRDNSSVKWLKYPIFNGHYFIDVVKLMS